MEISNKIYKNLHIREYKCEQNANGVIIAVHGFAGDKDSSVICALAEEMCKNNYHLISFDLPNHGENESNTPLNLNDCFEAVNNIDEYVKKEYKNYKISYFATSFGGYLLINLLNDNKYKYNKIILRAPAINMANILSNIIIPEHGYSLDILKVEDINLGYEKPLIINYKFYTDLLENDLTKHYINNNYLYIIQGQKDDVVNYKDNEKFFNTKCTKNHEIYYFPEADHRFKKPGESDKIIDITKNILLNT